MTWNVGSKIALGYGVAIVLLFSVGITSFMNISALIEATRLVDHAHEVLEEIEHLEIRVEDAETAQRGFIITGQDIYLEPYYAALVTIPVIDEGIREMTRDESMVQNYLDDLGPLIATELAEFARVIELRRNEGFEAAQAAVLSDQERQTMAEFKKVIHAMENDERVVLVAQVITARQTGEDAKRVILISVIFAFLVMLLLGVWTTRNLSLPLGRLVVSAGRISEGEIASIVVSDRTDEVGRLERAFENMIEYLKEVAGWADEIAEGNLTREARPTGKSDVLGQAMLKMLGNLRSQTEEIQSTATMLGGTAVEVSTTAAQLNEFATEVSAVVSETATTAQELKTTTERAFERADALSNSAQNALKVTQSGQKSVSQTIQVIHGIEEQMGTISESIVALREQTQTIGAIIATVNDVAEQSNLLSVNASIEAAKAGEEGKGFAVVATEIKNLAEQSKQATKQVETVLFDIQAATETTVRAVEAGTKAVEKGVQQSSSTGQSIESLMESIAEASQAALHIATSSREQSAGIDQVATAIDSIRDGTLKTAAGIQQSDVSAKQLAGLGQKLAGLANHYTV